MTLSKPYADLGLGEMEQSYCILCESGRAHVNTHFYIGVSFKKGCISHQQSIIRFKLFSSYLALEL